MKLFDLILRGGKTPEQEKQFLEEKLYLEDLARKIGARLEQQLKLNKLRGIYYSQDEVVAITSKDRLLFHDWKMKPVATRELVYSEVTVAFSNNTYPKKHFEAVGEALKWECEILLYARGNAPALFKTGKANIWLAPIIKRETDGKQGQEKKA